MTSREITSVVIRSAVIYILIQVILGVPVAFFYWHEFIKSPQVAVFLFSLVLISTVIMCIGLWRFSKKLIEKNIADSEDRMINISTVRLEKVILRCLGLFFFATNLHDLVYDVCMLFMPPNQYNNVDVKLMVVVDVAVICFSCFLIVSPGKWVGVIHKLKKQ